MSFSLRRTFQTISSAVVLPPPASTISRKNSDPDFVSPPSPTARRVNSSTRRTSNPLVYVRKKSRSAVASLLVLLVVAWLLLGEEVINPSKEGRGDYNVTEEEDFRESLRTRNQKNHHVPISRSRSNAAVHSPSTSHPPLSNSQELAALILFLTTATENVLPVSIDPSLPLNPEHIISHSLPTAPSARARALAEIERECWETHPVVVIGRSGHIWTNEARDLLAREDYLGQSDQDLGLVLVNGRPDTTILSDLFSRLTLSSSLPVIIVGGTPIGSYEQLKALHDQDHLRGLLLHAGATVGRDAEERKEKERKKRLQARKPKLRD